MKYADVDMTTFTHALVPACCLNVCRYDDGQSFAIDLVVHHAGVVGCQARIVVVGFEEMLLIWRAAV